MSTYRIVPIDSQACGVEVIDNYGIRHVMLGFETDADALQWIEADKQRERLFQDDLALTGC